MSTLLEMAPLRPRLGLPLICARKLGPTFGPQLPNLTQLSPALGFTLLGTTNLGPALSLTLLDATKLGPALSLTLLDATKLGPAPSLTLLDATKLGPARLAAGPLGTTLIQPAARVTQSLGMPPRQTPRAVAFVLSAEFVGLRRTAPRCIVGTHGGQFCRREQ
ncbi:hypothetical protein ACQP2F_21435 [Actinoplanes sp. CA-030573]|uniref:hypothetical protein n=1 Tax=Actinoplanes sp. CA-030573 TaxID=3239898 RepID=UPI003D8A8853